MEHSLWTFKVTGKPFCIHPPGNPPVTHPGGTSVFHLMLTKAQAEEVERVISDAETEMVRWEAETQSDEQQAERRTLFGIGKEDEVYPSIKCPTCYWFDPKAEGYCGGRVWPKEVVVQSIESHQAARDGFINCPLQVGKET